MHILLTGAAGRIGKRLLPILKHQHYLVKALTRHPAPDLHEADEQIAASLTQETDFDALLTGVDIVIHLADGFNNFEHLPADHESREAAQFLQTTTALARAAARNGVRIIYLSTIKTMCGTHASQPLTQASKATPQSLYGRLKLEAEQTILAAARDYGNHAVILRFPVVFGLGGGSMEQLLVLVDHPLPVPFAGLASPRSLISAHGLVSAITAIAKQPEAASGFYLVHDGTLCLSEMTCLIRKGLGRPSRKFRFPAPIWDMLEKLPALGPKVLRFTHPLELDDRHFRQTFNWQPPNALPISVVEWAKDHKNTT